MRLACSRSPKVGGEKRAEFSAFAEGLLLRESIVAVVVDVTVCDLRVRREVVAQFFAAAPFKRFCSTFPANLIDATWS